MEAEGGYGNRLKQLKVLILVQLKNLSMKEMVKKKFGNSPFFYIVNIEVLTSIPSNYRDQPPLMV